VKRQATIKAQRTGEPDLDAPKILSAEEALQREIAELGAWLAAQGLDMQGHLAPPDEGSRDRLYWRYGYFIGLKHALGNLTGRGMTMH
jgi:hypothetical protein